MEITYRNKKLRKICTDNRTAEKLYGRKMAEKLDMRLSEIAAADSVQMMVRFRIGRCHQLSNNRKGQYAVDLEHPYRLVFTVTSNEIEIANIMEIVDYH